MCVAVRITVIVLVLTSCRSYVNFCGRAQPDRIVSTQLDLVNGVRFQTVEVVAVLCEGRGYLAAAGALVHTESPVDFPALKKNKRNQ